MMHAPIIVVFSPGPMWVLSTSMVRTPDHFFFDLRNFCMAPILDCAMAAVMVGGMCPVPRNTTADFALPTKCAVLFLLVFFPGRTETFAGNEVFLESMIPHGADAVLVCQELHVAGAETQRLREAIVETQREENARIQPFPGDC